MTWDELSVEFDNMLAKKGHGDEAFVTSGFGAHEDIIDFIHAKTESLNAHIKELERYTDWEGNELDPEVLASELKLAHGLRPDLVYQNRGVILNSLIWTCRNRDEWRDKAQSAEKRIFNLEAELIKKDFEVKNLNILLESTKSGGHE